jgi:DNA-binding transcriptional MocR family regulator
MGVRADLLYEVFEELPRLGRDGTTSLVDRDRTRSLVDGDESASLAGPRGSFHFWLSLPEPWRAHEFVAQAAIKGVVVTPADAFAVGRAEVPHCVRVCPGAPASRNELVGALRQLVQILDAGPGVATSLLI